MYYKLTLNSIQNLTNILPILKIQIFYNEIVLFIESKYLLSTLLFLKNHTMFQYKILTCISGVDYPDRKYRFEIVYDLLSVVFNNRLRIKIIQNELQSLESCESIYLSANWYECEIWDMYGVFFKNHSNLKRILTDYGFEGYPLRKDFPLSGFIEMRYNEIEKRVIAEPIELAQEYRTFKFLSPWEVE